MGAVMTAVMRGYIDIMIRQVTGYYLVLILMVQRKGEGQVYRCQCQLTGAP